jgi:hypothetical protein
MNEPRSMIRSNRVRRDVHEGRSAPCADDEVVEWLSVRYQSATTGSIRRRYPKESMTSSATAESALAAATRNDCRIRGGLTQHVHRVCVPRHVGPQCEHGDATSREQRGSEEHKVGVGDTEQSVDEQREGESVLRGSVLAVAVRLLRPFE